MQKYKSSQKVCFYFLFLFKQENFVRICGNNINGSLGIGKTEQSSSDSVLHRLQELTNKRIYSLSCGDFHTLAIISGCNCTNFESSCKVLDRKIIIFRGKINATLEVM